MENVGLMVALAGAMTKAPTAEQVTTAVDAWLDDHPEATTTVQDGAITNAKLASSFVTPGTAAAYSSSATYAVGDYVFHNGALYRCTAAITTSESWTAAHWELASIGNDLSAIFGTSRNIAKGKVGRYQITSTGDLQNLPTSKTIAGLSDKSKCKGNTEYTITYYNLETIVTIFAAWYDEDGVFLSRTSNGGTYYTLTSPANAAYIGTFCYKANDGLPSIDSFEIQIEEGDKSTDYIPHHTAIDYVARETAESASSAAHDALTSLYGQYMPQKYICHFGAQYLNGQAVPWQSAYGIEYAARLGFRAIELNLQTTSDGEYVCLHGSGGKFGNDCYSLDNTDVSDVLINSKSLSYIKTNIRFKSSMAKFRVPMLTLEEALITAKRFGIIPAIQYMSGVAAIADKVCGKGNYVLNTYSLDRPSDAKGVINSWLTIANKDELLAKCNASGGAYVAGLAVTTSAYSGFTVDDFKELTETLHENGYRVSTAYVNNPTMQKLLSDAGFDYVFGTYEINDIVSPNVCCLNSDSTFSKFTTNGTVAAEEISLSNNQTVTPAETYDAVQVGGGVLYVDFVGSIIVLMGTFLNDSYTISSDGSEPIRFSTYFENEAPTFTIKASGNVTIKNISFKAFEA